MITFLLLYIKRLAMEMMQRMVKRLIYDYEERYDSALRTLKQKKSAIAEYNYNKILEFDLEYSALRQITYARRYRYLTYLRTISEMTAKNFNEWDKSEFLQIFDKLKRKNWSSRTLGSTLEMLKTFSRWLLGLETGQTVPFMKGFKFSNKERNNLTPSDMLDEKDITRLISSASSIRDKTVISFLSESGCRIGELLNLSIEDLKFEQGDGMVVALDGKTGQRTIRMFKSVGYIKAYLEQLGKTKGLLFNSEITVNKEVKTKAGKILKFSSRLEYAAITKQIKKIAKKAGVTKPVNCHNFRHSVASERAKDWTEAVMCKYFGWEIGSKMPANYIHLSSRDIDDQVRAINGITKKENKGDSTIACRACGMANIKTAIFCSNCGRALNESMLQEDIINKLMPMISQIIKDKGMLVSK
ncbi:MAG: tyrosine-type recombinase/integrase [Candidatus Nanoarchaeia archaeon]|nr:tyrosine-type recombinase/integrase [Candidatus Nanoarchaeia archaeon]